MHTWLCVWRSEKERVVVCTHLTHTRWTHMLMREWHTRNEKMKPILYMREIHERYECGCSAAVCVCMAQSTRISTEATDTQKECTHEWGWQSVGCRVHTLCRGCLWWWWRWSESDAQMLHSVWVCLSADSGWVRMRESAHAVCAVFVLRCVLWGAERWEETHREEKRRAERKRNSRWSKERQEEWRVWEIRRVWYSETLHAKGMLELFIHTHSTLVSSILWGICEIFIKEEGEKRKK